MIFKYKIFIILIIFFLFYNISNINIIKNLNQIKKNKNNKAFNGRIFLSFMYNNEAEMAYVHIWRLYDYVDKFIIIVQKKLDKLQNYQKFLWSE